MFFFLTFVTEDDRLKFELLFEKYKRLLLYKAYSILNDYSLAEDAVSEAFIRIYKNLGKIDDVNSPRAISFLITIVKNTSLTILEKQKKHGVPEDDIEIESGGDNMEETITSTAVTQDMLKIVDGLKEELRAPFLLKYAHNLSHKEIASILHISENNVTVRIHRAKNKLAKLFEKAGYVYE
jgi:RNA polymerase sigma-70 factor (ECF subfamily)